jgi:hypothetical protein
VRNECLAAENRILRAKIKAGCNHRAGRSVPWLKSPTGWDAAPVLRDTSQSRPFVQSRPRLRFRCTFV